MRMAQVTRTAFYTNVFRSKPMSLVTVLSRRAAAVLVLGVALINLVRAEDTEGKRHDEPLARSATYAAGHRCRFP